MPKINVLDKHIAELIAAGEVVERPSSVIKELIENSIDAGATSIIVEIKNGGIGYMRVTDNGCGISREDVPKAFLRHATSKLKTADDMDNISTLGFRGEALASISAVSKVTMITRPKDEMSGTIYKIAGSDAVSIDDIGCEKGTTIVIEDIFYNTPARMKFLKRSSSEGNSIAGVVDKMILSHPEISFKLIKDEKEIVSTQGDSELKSCIYAIYGRSFTESLIKVDYKLNGLTVNGYISKPSASRANRSMQNFFINGRYVKSKTAMVALEQAFKGEIVSGKFPSCVLNIRIPYEAVDVNVHPAKIEVRFIDERPIFDVIYHGVKTALLKDNTKDELILNKNDNKKSFDFIDDTTVKVSKEEPKQMKIDLDYSKKDKNSLNIYESKIVNSNSLLKKRLIDNEYEVTLPDKQRDYFEDVKEQKHNLEVKPEEESLNDLINLEQTQIDNDALILEDNKRDTSGLIEQEQDKKSFSKLIGEIFKTYIVVEEDEDIVLIDKHAAHERLIYEKLKKVNKDNFSQYLLKPQAVTLSKEEYDIAIKNKEIFEKAGFEIEDFGMGTVLVRSAPSVLDLGDIPDAVIEIVDNLSKSKGEVNLEKIDWIYHNIACRAAIKAGDNNDNLELMDIAIKMKNNPDLKHCPHGRPISIVIKKKEIEKKFGRSR